MIDDLQNSGYHISPATKQSFLQSNGIFDYQKITEIVTFSVSCTLENILNYLEVKETAKDYSFAKTFFFET